MKIKQILIKNFGKFQNKAFSFSPGLNVVYGENESGKSTLHTFLLSMLFGLEKARGRAAKGDIYTKYQPWNTASFYSGDMDLEVEGKPFHLERNFYHKEKSASLCNMEDGEELSVEYGDLQMLLGGMAHVPEGRRVFAQLSVLENLKLGAYTRKDKDEIEESLQRVYKSFPRLEERKNQLAGTLSGGEQQMLAMGRALMSKPRIILMDEPSMGLSPIFVEEIFNIIKEVSASGTTVLLVEQNAKKALSIADRAYVLETGKVVLEGKASDLMEDESIKKAYLGE